MPDIAQLSRYTYNPRSRRYTDRVSGRFVAAKDVRQAVDAIIDKETDKIRNVAQQLVDGQINLAEWQIQTTAILKKLHVAMGIAANGGFQNMSQADLGYIGSLVKKQYKFLRSFAKQIKNGGQALDGTLVSRSALYTQASRNTYEDVAGRSARNGGMKESRSILGTADHCSLCLSEAKRGWVPIGSNIPIGERTCLANCHCSLEYR